MDLLISLAANLEDKHKLQQVYNALVRNDRIVAISHLSYMAITEIKHYNDIFKHIMVIIIIASIIISKYLIVLVLVPIIYMNKPRNTNEKAITKIMEEIPHMNITEDGLNQLKKALY